MSYLAKAATGAKRISCTTAVLALMLGSCSPGSGDQNDKNSGGITSDTTQRKELSKKQSLQPVEEITIRTVGDDKTGKHFDTDTIEAKPGTLLKLSLVNEGSEQSMIHNIVFTRSGKSTQVALAGEKVGAPGNYIPDDSVRVLAGSSLALPGQTVVLEFEAPREPGPYDFVCTYPEHYKHMKGVLIVK